MENSSNPASPVRIKTNNDNLNVIAEHSSSSSDLSKDQSSHRNAQNDLTMAHQNTFLDDLNLRHGMTIVSSNEHEELELRKKKSSIKSPGNTKESKKMLMNSSVRFGSKQKPNRKESRNKSNKKLDVKDG